MRFPSAVLGRIGVPPPPPSQARRVAPRAARWFRPECLGLERRELLSHYRYGNLTWEPAPGAPDAVLFHFQFAARLGSSSGGGPLAAGDVVTDDTGGTGFNYGDGQGVGRLSFRVLSINVPGNYYLAEAVHDAGGGNYAEGLVHTYSAPGTYIAYSETSARISALQNNANGAYRTETIVNVGAANSAPVASLPPIVQVADDAIATFQVPAADPNGDPLRYRLATSQEASGTSGYTQPPGLTISPSGLVTWDIRDGVVNTRPGDLWTAQVVVEDLDGAGAVKSKTSIDFILQVVASVAPPPEFDLVPSGPIEARAGQPMSFVVQASGVDLTTTVAVQALNPPIGMTFAIEPPLAGSRSNAAAVRARFTPNAEQAGQTFVITFLATNDLGLTAQTSVTLVPTAPGPVDPPVPPPPAGPAAGPPADPPPAAGNGPVVLSLARYGFHEMPTRLVLSFDQPLDPATARNVGNYRIVGPGGRTIPVRSAVYDAARRTVTLRPAKRLRLQRRYVLTVNGAGQTGVRGASGRLLDGARTGRPGSNHVVAVVGKLLVLPGPIANTKPKPKPMAMAMTMAAPPLQNR